MQEVQKKANTNIDTETNRNIIKDTRSSKEGKYKQKYRVKYNLKKQEMQIQVEIQRQIQFKNTRNARVVR